MIKKNINDLFAAKQTSATRKFTDRTDFIKAFWSNLSINDDLRILNYYGIGGIGKTALRKEIIKQINENSENTQSAYIDFEEKEHRDSSNALFYLRSELKSKYKMKFPYFDFAYARYMKLRSPQFRINEETFPLLEEGDLLVGILSELGEIPFIGLPAKIGKVIGAGYKIYKNHSINYDLEQLHSISNMDAVNLLKRLPHYFAYDITKYLDNTQEKLVILMDSFETLYEYGNIVGSYHEVDMWLREELIPYLPQVLWIIFGREKLKWEEIDVDWIQNIEGHLIKRLSESDIRDFLVSCQIDNEDVQNRIIKISEGHPYSIDLLVDTYYSIIQTRLPIPDDFGIDSSQQKLFIRFMKHLNASEKEILKVLSLTKYWNKEIFVELIKNFNINFSITCFVELNRFSFIEEKSSNKFIMYSLMQKNLQSEIVEELKRDVNEFMYNYYNKKLIENPKANYVIEAFFHGRYYLGLDHLCNWMYNHRKLFKYEGNIIELVYCYEEILASTKLREVSKISYPLLYDLIEIYFLMGKYDHAEKILLELMEFRDEEQQEKINWLLASNYKETYKYNNALESYKNYFNRFDHKKLQGMNLRYCEALIDYGKLLVYLSKYEDAVSSYKKALDLLLSYRNQYKDVSILLNLAIVYEKLGEVHGFLEEIEMMKKYYEDGLSAYNYIFDSEYEDEIEVAGRAKILNNQGFLQKRMAEYYVWKSVYKQAKEHYTNAIDIYNTSILYSPYYIDTFKKKGFALRGLMRIHGNEQNKKETFEYLMLVEDAFNKALDLNSSDVSSIHSKGGAYVIYGNVLKHEGDFEQALKEYYKAVTLSKQALEIQPDYLYAYDGLTETLIAIAELYEILGNMKESIKYYDEGLAVISNLLEKNPEASYALIKKDKIFKKLTAQSQKDF